MRVVAICRTRATSSEQRLLERMHELRARIFKHRLDWDVHVEHDQEKDEYDRLDPTYLVLVGNDDQVVGCARLLPSTGPTMLGQTFPFLAGDARMPQSSRVVESSRFCIDTERSDIVSASGLRDATHTLFAGIIEWSMGNGFDRIVTVTDVRFERILSRAKWPLERLGSPHPIGNTIAVAGLLSADEASLELVRPSSYVPLFPAAVEAAA